jgi:hypothetical protein
MLRLAPRFIFALFLAACGTATSTPPAGGSPFDGTYVGSLVLARQIGQCAPVPGATSLTIMNGQVTLLLNPATNTRVMGPVQADGTVNAMGFGPGGPVNLVARVQDGSIVGQAASQNCVYSLSMKRQ